MEFASVAIDYITLGVFHMYSPLGSQAGLSSTTPYYESRSRNGRLERSIVVPDDRLEPDALLDRFDLEGALSVRITDTEDMTAELYISLFRLSSLEASTNLQMRVATPIGLQVQGSCDLLNRVKKDASDFGVRINASVESLFGSDGPSGMPKLALMYPIEIGAVLLKIKETMITTPIRFSIFASGLLRQHSHNIQTSLKNHILDEAAALAMYKMLLLYVPDTVSNVTHSFIKTTVVQPIQTQLTRMRIPSIQNLIEKLNQYQLEKLEPEIAKLAKRITELALVPTILPPTLPEARPLSWSFAGLSAALGSSVSSIAQHVPCKLQQASEAAFSVMKYDSKTELTKKQEKSAAIYKLVDRLVNLILQQGEVDLESLVKSSGVDVLLEAGRISARSHSILTDAFARDKLIAEQLHNSHAILRADGPCDAEILVLQHEVSKLAGVLGITARSRTSSRLSQGSY